MIVDGHCDTLKEAWKRDLSLDSTLLNFNIMDTKTPMIQMMAIYISPEEAENGFEVAEKVIAKFEREKENHKNIVQIYNREDIEKVRDDKIGIILTAENGSIIQGNLNNIDKLYDKGIRIMSIVWNEQNDLASGALTKEDKGLTKLGIEYVKYLNKKNILIDVSHASEKTFWDTIKYTTKPVVATHSCAYNICNHPRNLKDNQIRQIAKREGIIGIPFCSQFLNRTGKANIQDIIKHIKYIKKLVGIDYVGIGSDFDGLDEEDILADMKSVKDIWKLEKELKKENFTKQEINKVLGDNWIRVLKSNMD